MTNDESTREFLQFFTQYHRQIYAYIRAQVRCASDANDVLQETTTLLWEKFDDFDRSRDFGRWACGFARRLVLRHYRENGRLPLFGERVDELFAEQLANSVQAEDERSDALSACMKELESRQRTILDLRYQSEREIRDIAQQLNRSESAIYKSLSKIHELLYECIQQKLAQWGVA